MVNKIGILGGGQLALMMLPSIRELGLKSFVLDKKGSSSEGIADEFIEGDYSNPEDCLKLKHCDVVTIEIENISLQGLQKLEATGVRVIPSYEVLSVIRDKGLQKQFYQKNQIPTSDFYLGKLNHQNVDNKVIKLREGGYDGKGVWVPKPGDQIPKNFIDQDLVIEEKIEIQKELAVVVCRSLDKKIYTYQMVEMVMEPELNLLDYQFNPAHVDISIQEEAEVLAKKIAEQLNYIGVLAVEFFLDKNNKLWVNELAPRVHNSGHNTIESAPTGQFENHIRAISGLEINQTTPAQPSLTMNLIGQGQAGATQVLGVEELPKNVFIHLYNKKESRPGRKMGHLTIIGSYEEALEVKENLKNQIKIKGKE